MDLGRMTPYRPELNPFERDVMRRLSADGIPLTAQIGASGYRIDFCTSASDGTRPHGSCD
jgi:hypothetical protein